MKSLVLSVLFALFTTVGLSQQSEYADTLIEAHIEKRFSNTDHFYGGKFGQKLDPIDPKMVLGNNIYYVSIPKNSYIIVGFTDNEIIDYPGQPDIFISEEGCAKESGKILVSNDGKEFTQLGIIRDCKQAKLDLADINFTEPVRFIKIIGMDSRGESPGFDLISVKGLPNANRPLLTPPIVVPVPVIEEKATETIPVKKSSVDSLVLYFAHNSSSLTDTAIMGLTALLQVLDTVNVKQITITGHTDITGEATYNQQLGLKRAEKVSKYLISQGISKQLISVNSMGETQPIYTNTTSEGRQKNRRTVISISLQ